MKLLHAIFGAFALMTAVARAGPITLIDTLGSSNSFTTSNPYTMQTGVSALAVQFTVTQTTIIDEVDVAGQGDLQLRWASNSPGNLPTTPFFGGVGVNVNGFADVTGNFGTLLPGTYWIEYLTSFFDLCVTLFRNGVTPEHHRYVRYVPL